jgi:hypothetical protein
MSSDDGASLEPVDAPAEPTRPARTRRGRRPSAVPREVIMGLDATERKVSFIGAFVAFALAGLFVPHLVKNTYLTDTANPTKGHACTAPFHWDAAKSLCVHVRLTHPSYWVPQFALILLVGVSIGLSAWWKKRVGVAFSGFLIGLALGTVGLPFLLLGGWLLVRALRLQRYGDPSFFGSSRKAREAADARRAVRGSTRPERPERAAATRSRRRAAPEPAARTAPTPSKRYTPKKPVRKR